ncbi:hypothetical protein C0Q70_00925 [Pomacea canaliculata]|uniref:Uncharacterized protein n=1 Tax=Pomacea canaliculata TaxID=400727 RepID=A0A2T7PY18_POMCA|nr:hypothetical protein C0Q70_00925 [Pomacea canaliculata]
MLLTLNILWLSSLLTAIQVQQVAALDTTTAMGIAAGCVLGVAALAVLLVLLWVKCRHKISASLDAKQESYKSFDGEGDFVLSPGCYTITNPGFELGPDTQGPDTQGPIVLTTVPGPLGVDADEVPPASFTLSTFSNQEESVDQPQSSLPSTVVDREAVSVSQQPLITSTSLGDEIVPDSPHSVSQSYVFCQETVPDSPQSVNLSPVSGQDSGLDLSQSFIILENPNAVVDDQNCT